MERTAKTVSGVWRLSAATVSGGIQMDTTGTLPRYALAAQSEGTAVPTFNTDPPPPGVHIPQTWQRRGFEVLITVAHLYGLSVQEFLRAPQDRVDLILACLTAAVDQARGQTPAITPVLPPYRPSPNSPS